MADDVDMAQDKADEALQRHIANAVQHAHTVGRPDCVDCGDPIPEARRRANGFAIRCVDCQEDFEEANS